MRTPNVMYVHRGVLTYLSTNSNDLVNKVVVQQKRYDIHRIFIRTHLTNRFSQRLVEIYFPIDHILKASSCLRRPMKNWRVFWKKWRHSAISWAMLIPPTNFWSAVFLACTQFSTIYIVLLKHYPIRF